MKFFKKYMLSSLLGILSGKCKGHIGFSTKIFLNLEK